MCVAGRTLEVCTVDPESWQKPYLLCTRNTHLEWEISIEQISALECTFDRPLERVVAKAK